MCFDGHEGGLVHSHHTRTVVPPGETRDVYLKITINE